MINKLVILALGTLCFAAGVHAATLDYPQLIITTTQGGSGVDYVNSTTTMTMDATASDVDPSSAEGDVFINVTLSTFSLTADLATGLGSLTIGSLLNANVSDFVFTPTFISETTGNTGSFEATLDYTSGELAGLYEGGILQGSAHSVSTIDFGAAAWSLESIQARIGPVDPTTVIPVPAAVWLFGSGLVGLIGIAKRKKAA